MAELNLACASGLTGSEMIDHGECIRRLNHCARGAAEYTQERMPVFLSDPEVYHNSVNKFRVVCMVRFLQRFGGIRYNPAKIPEDAPFYTEDCFIHGALMGFAPKCLKKVIW